MAVLFEVFSFPCFDRLNFGMDHVSIPDSMKRTTSIAFRWIFFLSYAALVLILSMQSSLPGQSRIPDKLEHALEYLLFAVLTARALQKSRTRHLPSDLALAYIFCVVFAALDEFVQSNIPGRDASLGDWLADISGITVAIILLLKRSYKECVLPAMKQLKLFLLFTFLFYNLSFATEIMPLSEIKEGMTGVGRTVFKGNEIEEFQVEILGVLRNYLPQQNLILGMLKGGNLEETGVIAGMSGSPVYINGKIIGAVAYSWQFAKKPIAGITPIESMLKAKSLPTEQPPVAPPIEVANYFNFENLLTSHFQDSTKIQTSLPQFGEVQLMPIAAPLTVSGFEPRVLDRFTPLFSALGMKPVQGGAAAGSTDEKLPSNLEPGSPVSVQLIQGDFDIGAIGTVTYRDEDKVLAFGHPFYNLGPINFPMATARIYAVVPSLYSSFKVGSAGSVVGSVKQDLHSAIMGVMGSKSPMIPVTVKMNDGDDKARTFRFEVANHKLLSPILLDFAFQNSILVTQLGYSESTLKVNGIIGVKGKSPVVIGNIFSGAGSFTTASQYVASIVYALMSNEFQNVDIEDVNIEVETSMKRNESELLEVWLDRNEVRPGEEVKLKAMYRPLHGSKESQEFTVRIPEDVQLNQLYFMVGGGQELSRQEFAIYGKAYQPDNLDQLIGLLNGLRANDRIYVKAFTNEPSLVMKGQFLSSLPSSAFSILSSSQTIGSSARVNRLALWEDSKPVGSYLTGYRIFSVHVLPRQN